MNVGQLIAHLQQFPPDLDVVVDGYEGGYDNPCIYETTIDWDRNTDERGKVVTTYFGRHGESYNMKRPRTALVIGREEG